MLPYSQKGHFQLTALFLDHNHVSIVQSQMII